MPAKRGARVQKFHEGAVDDQPPVFSFFIEKDGEGPYGRIDVEVFINKVPRVSEIFLQNCSVGLTGDKKNSKRGSVKQHRFIRLTNEGLQVGGHSTSRAVSLSEVESEIGRISHGIGVVSLCRSSAALDDSFFFCLTDDRTELESLDKRHPAFGRVVSGLETLLSLRDALIPYVKEDCIIEGGPFTILELVPKTTS